MAGSRCGMEWGQGQLWHERRGGCRSHSRWFSEPRPRLRPCHRPQAIVRIPGAPSSSSPSTYCLRSDFLPVPPARAAPTSCLPWSGCPEGPEQYQHLGRGHLGSEDGAESWARAGPEGWDAWVPRGPHCAPTCRTLFPRVYAHRRAHPVGTQRCEMTSLPLLPPRLLCGAFLCPACALGPGSLRLCPIRPA